MSYDIQKFRYTHLCQCVPKGKCNNNKHRNEKEQQTSTCLDVSRCICACIPIHMLLVLTRALVHTKCIWYVSNTRQTCTIIISPPLIHSLVFIAKKNQNETKRITHSTSSNVWHTPMVCVSYIHRRRYTLSACYFTARVRNLHHSLVKFTIWRMCKTLNFFSVYFFL